MKTSFLKLVTPVLLFGGAVAGAFATNSEQAASKNLSHVAGFVKLNPLGTLCDQPEMCTTIPGDICTVASNPSGTQLWGKNENDRCVVELYRIP